MKIARFLVAATATAVLAACNGTNYNNVYSSPTQGPACVIPSPFLAVYPKNYTTVPLNTTNVYIATQVNVANNFSVVLQPPNGLPLVYGTSFVQVQASQLPAGSAKPHFSNPLYFASNVGGLIANATYQAGYNNNGTGCTPTLFLTFSVR